MRRSLPTASFSLLFLALSLLASHPLHSQAPPASVTVRMLDAVDSSKDPAGKQYRASVTKAVDAGNGVMIPQGATAAVTLANSNGSGWTTQLVSVTINGQPVAVTSGSATVTAAAQSAAAGALSSVNSVLGGFGRHVSAPSAVTAVATGQRVVLPPGVTLSFVLSQPPAASQASAGPQAAPAAPQAIAAAAPATNPAPGPPAAAAAAPGQHWWICQYVDPKDLNKPVLGSRVYYSVFPDFDSNAASLGEVGGMAYSSAMVKHFIGYVRQSHKVTDLPGNPTGQYNGRFGGYCKKLAGPANGMDLFGQAWRAHNMEPIQVDFADTSAQGTATDARLATTAASAPPPPAAPAGAPFIICATSGGPGMDTYLTGVFQTTRVKHMPNGGVFVDQTILDNFYAYLKQKGYTYKPGSNYGCAVEPTAAEAKADEAKRQSGCSNCGKIVETGWTE